MAVPIELEIFMKDLTKAGLASVAKNVEGAEQETLSLIKALQQVRAEYVRALNAKKEAGKSYQQEAAMVQALTGQIKGLKEGLKELEAAKKQSSATPVVDADAVARKTGNLRLQFQQVARELPSLAMGPQMFILAISNNLPMLADAIADVRKQNELLKASGQKSVPVWKQLVGSLFSWQTGLVAAISLGIVFGKAFGLDGQFIEIAAITEFEEEVDVVAVEVDVEKLGDCAVTDLAMDDQLVLEMREEFGIAKMLEIDDLAGNRFASCDVFALPNASECARTDEVHEFVRADLVRFLTH